ncbi:MAG: MucB/RseB C-terminal domain-containing protein [Chromatiales bacterium]|nr:MucB/RseB C-terminal domain-containing protein [Chromatiales bacterium]
MIRILFLFVLFAPLTLWADESEKVDAGTLLFAMSQAMHEVNYKGTFTYRRADQMQGIEITHGVKGQREFERMVTLNGPAREIVRDDENVRCEFQHDDPFMVEQSGYPHPFAFSDPAQLNQIEQFYKISGDKSAPIAGFDNRKITLMPKDNYRYGYRFWIATDAPHLLLRSEMVTGSGVILEQMLFTSLKIMESPPDALDTAVQLKQTPSNNISSKSGSFDWHVTQLPPGYRRETERFSSMVTGDNHRQKVEHHLYSDGFSSVSLFIELINTKQEDFHPVASQMGAVSLVSYLVGEHKIVVVGEVPLATAELIAHSIKRVGKH